MSSTTPLYEEHTVALARGLTGRALDNVKVLAGGTGHDAPTPVLLVPDCKNCPGEFSMATRILISLAPGLSFRS